MSAAAAATSSAHSTARPTRIIALLNQKGGVGKTTTTCNLGDAMAKAGRKVALIDLDPQAHLSLHLGVEAGAGAAEGDAADAAGEAEEVEHDGPPRPTVYDVLVEPEVSADEAFIEINPNLWLMPAETDLAAAETELAGQPDRNHRLRDKLRASEIMREIEFLLIDCPPSLGLLTLNALVAAREVMVPMQAHFLALQGVGKLLQTVGLVSSEVNPDLRVTGIILCMHDAQTKLSTEVTSDLESFFAANRNTDAPWSTCRLLKPAIRRNIKLAESPSFGQSIFDYDDKCAGAHDYRELAGNLMREWDAFLARRGERKRAGQSV